MKRKLYVSTIIATWGVAMAYAGIAAAEDAAAPPATASTAAGDSGVIIVTAQRRSEDVKTVPSSISVLSGTALQDNHITNLEDISRAVPGVSFGAGGGPGLDNIEMRGVSSTSGSATVGIYLDDVPITQKNLYNGAVEPKLFDMARVEILRGPQGTLFGASSEGGAIRFISNLPDLDHFSVTSSAEGSGTVHGAGNYEFQTVVNQPFANGRGAIRFGVDVGQLSGWIDNLGCCGTSIPGVAATDTPEGQLARKNVNDEHWLVGRLSVKMEVTDTLTVTAAGFAERDNSGDTSVYYPDVGLYKQEKEVAEPIHDKILVGSLTIDKDLGFAKLSSISSYFHQTLDRIQDGTFYNSVYFADYVIPDSYTNPNNDLIGQLPSPQISNTHTRTMSQEIRLTSNTSPEKGDKFSWVAGLFLSQYDTYNLNIQTIENFTQEFTNLYGVSPGNSAVAEFQGVDFNTTPLADFTTHDREQQIAGFANLTYAPIPALRLIAGLRESYAPGFYQQNLSGFFIGTSPIFLKSKTHFTNLTPKFSISYDANRDVTLYASAGKGDRLGGGNYYIPSFCGQDLSNLGLATAPTSYNTDTLWSYEGGLKGRFLNNKLSVNADFFYIKWHNIQQTIDLPICGSQLNVNIGDAASYGPEFELNARPFTGLTVGLTFSYTHAAITRINPQYDTLGITAGQSIINVPKYMASARFDYTHPVTEDARVFVRADYDYTGASFGSLTLTDPSYRQPGYTVMNGSVGMAYRNYEFSIFAKNLLNSTKIIQVPSLLFVPEAYTLRPLTVGALLKLKI